MVYVKDIGLYYVDIIETFNDFHWVNGMVGFSFKIYLFFFTCSKE